MILFTSSNRKYMLAIDPIYTQSSRKIVIEAGANKLSFYGNEIYYLEAMQNYVQIHTQSGRHLVLMTLKRLMNLLPDTQFCQTHRSYVVNLNKVERFGGNHVKVNETLVPVSKRKRKDIMQIIRNQKRS